MDALGVVRFVVPESCVGCRSRGLAKSANPRLLSLGGSCVYLATVAAEARASSLCHEWLEWSVTAAPTLRHAIPSVPIVR